MDYVIKQDRGKAAAIIITALSLGVITSFQVLFRFIKDIDAEIAWSIMGGLMIFFSIIYFTIIKEPVDIEKNTNSLCKQMKDLVVNVCKAVKKNPNILMGWIMNIFAVAPVLFFKIYILSWLNYME